MKFTECLNQKDLFNMVRGMYDDLIVFEEFDPHVCDPIDRERIAYLSKKLFLALTECQETIEELQTINTNSYEC